ncbi:hypothetical protein Cs7R123_66630 [Catellatospora sp. TT07R-123]|uniref:SRPBCC family protein n=1 Tax=Catellatospora sp. TT07R-123 TaxID=2733863 RepID=UPI001B0B233D|nr:SRPBCC family protein [Catellatospora sp. TT07R-123]GHJ49321.1 hypothetical protein Cs7R123_66630 [Catellatospora sp. TT07R-123]
MHSEFASYHEHNVTYCLERITAPTAGWKTLVAQASAVTDASPQQVWRVWSDLSGWPGWSPLHTATAWAGTPGFAVGARFDQTLALGFPVGTKTEQATLAELEPGSRAAWAGDSGGVRSCHSWQFTPTASGGTHISNVEALTGTAVGLVRPLVARRWNSMFQGAVDGLVRTATA